MQTTKPTTNIENTFIYPWFDMRTCELVFSQLGL